VSTAVTVVVSLPLRYGNSKLLDVQSKVDEVKVVMQNNVATALDNVESMHDMEAKSDRFENRAMEFQKSEFFSPLVSFVALASSPASGFLTNCRGTFLCIGSTNLKKMMRCRYYKVDLEALARLVIACF
jgi:hypothetical protein